MQTLYQSLWSFNLAKMSPALFQHSVSKLLSTPNSHLSTPNSTKPGSSFIHIQLLLHNTHYTHTLYNEIKRKLSACWRNCERALWHPWTLCFNQGFVNKQEAVLLSVVCQRWPRDFFIQHTVMVKKLKSPVIKCKKNYETLEAPEWWVRHAYTRCLYNKKQT